MVTVVDAANLLANYSSHDFLRDRGEVAGPEDERALVDLLVEQIDFADVRLGPSCERWQRRARYSQPPPS